MSKHRKHENEDDSSKMPGAADANGFQEADMPVPDLAVSQEAAAKAQGDAQKAQGDAAKAQGDAEGGPAPEGAASEKAALAESQTKVKALEDELSALKDQYLRKLADYENFRKRMFRERDDAVQFANSQLLADLVDVLDNFDRAVQSSETSREFQSLHDGEDMIRKHFLGLLENKYGLARFESLNQPFDPNLHEAMMSEQGECADPLVIEEYSKGYKLRERVLRTAKVKVRMPAAQA